MIEAGLYIAAGFLGAVLLAMIIAPTVWRRAVYLTKRRIAEQMPLTVSELQADKDRLRAGHAIAEKKLDVALRKQRDLSTDQAAQISDMTETLKVSEATIAERDTAIADLSARIANLEEELGLAQAELVATQLDLDTNRVSLSARAAELESTAHLKSELERQLSTAGEQIDEKAGQIGVLDGRIAELREKLRAQQAQIRTINADAKQTAELLKTERAGAAELGQRHERLIQRASDLEEKLARREKEIARLRESHAGEEADFQELELRALDAEEERAALEAELGEMTVRYGRLGKLLGDREPEAVIAGFDAKIAQLETDLEAERKRVERLQAAKAENGGNQEAGDAALRGEIAALAAEIVNMAATLEGDASPVPALVAEAGETPSDAPVSLAARVRDLQRRAAEAHSAGDGVPAGAGEEPGPEAEGAMSARRAEQASR